MSVTTPFEPIAEVFERNLSVRHVYAEPVHHGDTTVIPAAWVTTARFFLFLPEGIVSRSAAVACCGADCPAVIRCSTL